MKQGKEEGEISTLNFRENKKIYWKYAKEVTKGDVIFYEK